ncbi:MULTISPECIES: hypothetical protein [unclassified Streptomyces]|uniref:hypothetical protein n=1 Tax=unclassified Streptomyces TaxID=2593676 RepID=UPI000DB9BC63|nr:MULTISPECIES: hypothetical protein [unclassified Streptomyces]MYT71304.1 hypothetical protein [Streptomyces sp. SID8367]RAJ82758.1 hypothetical protein K377_03808 [Streptomyces sp. PsTaAH-137]
MEANDGTDGLNREDRLLMLAVCGEALPDDEPDAADVAADIALLRAQVRGIGDALAARPAPKPVPAPVRAPVPDRRRRPLRIAFGALVAACAAGVVGGLVWLGSNAPGGISSDAGASNKSVADGGKAAGDESSSSPALHIACSKVLVEGRVVSITPRGDGDVRVVLDVTRSYRPERSAEEQPTLTVTLDGSAEADLKPGTYTLIRTPVFPEDREDWETGWGVKDARRGIVDALPEARGLTCPGPGY